MNHIARTVTSFGLLLAFSQVGSSGPKDLFGWQGTRWGMSSQEIVKVFGSKAKKLPRWQLYGDGYLEYIVPGINLKGGMYTAYFMMDAGSSKLREIHLRLDQMESPVPRDDVFDGLNSLLTHQYGAPTRKDDERSPEVPIKSLRLSRTWKFPTTTVELFCQWDSGHSSLVTIRYFPSKLKSDVTTTHNKALQLTAR